MNNRQKSKKSKTAVEYEQQIGELTAALQRVAADFENYKKQTSESHSRLLDTAKEEILTQLLPALDNFDRAADHLPKELEGNSWAQGMSYVGTQLNQILDDMGVKKYSVKDEIFDESRAEAVEYINSTKPDGMIVEEISPGYEVNGRVVRAAVVKVSNNSAKKNNIKQGEK